MNINISSQGLPSILSDSLTIQNFLYSLTAKAFPFAPTVNFTFNISVTLKGEDQLLFIGSSEVTSNTLNGNTSLSTNTGQANFSYFYPNNGTKTFNIFCGDFSTTLSVTILPLILQIISINPIVLYI